MSNEKDTRSALRDEIRTKATSMVREEETEIPGMGVRVLMRGMMLGQRSRVVAEGMIGTQPKARMFAMVIGFCTFDPGTRKSLWNINNADHVEDIEALPPEAGDHLFSIGMRLSGLDTDGRTAAEVVEQENPS